MDSGEASDDGVEAPADGHSASGARPPRAAPSEAARVTRAEINLAHVRSNLRELKTALSSTSPKPPRVWAVLKADAYGHGSAAVGVSLDRAGVDGLCVALLEEGLELRSAGVACPILVMGGYYGRYRDGLEALVDNRLTPVIYGVEGLEALASTVRYLDRAPIGVHLKIDSGMGRLGVRPEELAATLEALGERSTLRLDGLMTHLACADAADLEDTRFQLARFDSMTSAVGRAGLAPRMRHAANSAALLRLPDAHYDVVRPGIALYGAHPCPEHFSPLSHQPKLKPAMRVLTEVVALRQVPAGEAIGYGHSWRASRASHIATIAMGYADGLSRNMSNQGHVLIGGRRAPIVGMVSMDMAMIDVTDVPDAAVRDEVVIVGRQKGRHGQDEITAHQLAEASNTIVWDCLTSISRRVPRFYRHP